MVLSGLNSALPQETRPARCRSLDLQFAQNVLYAHVGNLTHDVCQWQGHMPHVTPRNPQTVAPLDLLGLPYNLDPAAQPLAQPQGLPAAGECAPEHCDLHMHAHTYAVVRTRSATALAIVGL